MRPPLPPPPDPPPFRYSSTSSGSKSLTFFALAIAGALLAYGIYSMGTQKGIMTGLWIGVEPKTGRIIGVRNHSWVTVGDIRAGGVITNGDLTWTITFRTRPE